MKGRAPGLADRQCGSNSHDALSRRHTLFVADLPECCLMVTSIQNRKGWSAADRQPCFYPLWIPARLVIHRLVVVVPSGIVSGLMGLATSLRETPVKVPRIGAGARQRRGCGATAASKCAGVEAGICMALRSPQRRSLVARGSSQATTMIEAALAVFNAETPTQLRRDLVPHAGSRSQLVAGELFASTWGGRFSPAQQRRWSRHRPPFISPDDTGVVGRDSSCSRRNCYRGGVGHLSPSLRDCDQKGSADEHCRL